MPLFSNKPGIIPASLSSPPIFAAPKSRSENSITPGSLTKPAWPTSFLHGAIVQISDGKIEGYQLTSG